MANTIKVNGGNASGRVIKLITKSVTENGVYSASSENADGYTDVTVDVEDPNASVTKFRYVKWHITSIWGNQYFQVSELGFCDTADNQMTFPQGMSATSSLSLLSIYTIDNLFDGDTNTKIVTEFHSGDVEDITIDFGDGNELDITQYPYYYWGSSDDDETYRGRTPLVWQFFGANESDFSDAVLLDEVTNFTPYVKNKEMAYRGLMVSQFVGARVQNLQLHEGLLNVGDGTIATDSDYYYSDEFDMPQGNVLFDFGTTGSVNGIALYNADSSYLNGYTNHQRRRYVDMSSYYQSGRKARLSFAKANIKDVIVFDYSADIIYSGSDPVIVGEEQYRWGGFLTTKSITENGTYNAVDDGANGYSSVTVDISSQRVKDRLFLLECVGRDTAQIPEVNQLTEGDSFSEYLTFNTTTRKFTVLKSFDAVVVAWVYQYQGAMSPGQGAFYLNGTETYTYNTNGNGLGATGGVANIVQFNVGDEFYVYTRSSSGYPQQYLKIYIENGLDIGNTMTVTPFSTNIQNIIKMCFVDETSQ